MEIQLYLNITESKTPLYVLIERAFGLEKNSPGPTDSMTRLRLGLISNSKTLRTQFSRTPLRS